MPENNPNADLFRFCPSCGKQMLKPESVKSFQCKACGFLFFINCASAAIAVILDDKNRVLTTIRAHDPAKGTLDLPGGFSEPGEGIEEALTREIKEELNLDVISMRYLCSFPNTYPYKQVTYPITDMAFVCKVKTFDTITAMDDVAGFKFLALNTLDISAFGMESARKTLSFLKRDQSV